MLGDESRVFWLSYIPSATVFVGRALLPRLEQAGASTFWSKSICALRAFTSVSSIARALWGSFRHCQFVIETNYDSAPLARDTLVTKKWPRVIIEEAVVTASTTAVAIFSLQVEKSTLGSGINTLAGFLGFHSTRVASDRDCVCSCMKAPTSFYLCPSLLANVSVKAGTGHNMPTTPRHWKTGWDTNGAVHEPQR